MRLRPIREYNSYIDILCFENCKQETKNYMYDVCM